MRRCLILGGSGHLGTALRAAARAGDEIAFSHATRPQPGSMAFTLNGAEPLPAADIAVGSFPMARQLEGASQAAIGERVARYLDRIGDAALVQLTTDAVYSGRAGERREEDAADPVTPYGIAQAALDEALLARGAKILLVRTSFIFGFAASRPDKRLGPIIAGERPAASQRWADNLFKSPTEVNFLAEGIWRAIDAGLSGILNIAGPRTSVHDFFRQALAPIGSIALPDPWRETDPAVPRDTSLNTERMEATLGLHAGETWQWYRRYSHNPPAD